MNHIRFLWAALLLAFFIVPGCQNDPGADTAMGPTDPQTADADAITSASHLGDGADLFAGESASVYTISNAVSGNAILRFSVSEGGSLSPSGSFETGGTGTGAGLGSQGALVKQGTLLFAVNAGSDEISAMRLVKHGLQQVDKVASGGTMPISLTVRGDLLYVLNAGGSGNISGFRGAASGHLRPIPGSTMPLSGAGVAPAQIGFSPTRMVLVVTEKASNKIVSYEVGHDGRAHGPIVQSSTGDTPFGFDFTPRGYLVVSDAYGGSPLLSALSSYRVGHAGTVNLVTGPVQDMQTAACWVVISSDGRFAYTTNFGTNNISGYRVARDGGLTLFGDGGNTAASDAGPIDMALSHNSRILYCLNAGGHSITSYRRDTSGGGLSPLGSVSGIPVGAAGLAAD
jgi:6-phosphogluconolactonase